MLSIATLFIWVFNILHFSASYGHHQVFQIAKYLEDGIVAMVIFSGGVRFYSLQLNRIYKKRVLFLIYLLTYLLHGAESFLRS